MSKDSRQFEKAAFGYRPDEVDRTIDELNRRIAALEAEKAEQQAKMKILADKINEYRAEEGTLKDALLEAQRVKNAIEGEARVRADEMIAQAEARSQQLKAESKTHATRLLSEAKNRADKMLADAKRQADEAVSAVRGQVENEQRILSRMQREVSSFKATLISIYRSHLNLITSLPEEERKRAGVSNPEAPKPEASKPEAFEPEAATGKQANEKAALETEPAPAEEPVSAEAVSDGEMNLAAEGQDADEWDGESDAGRQAAFAERFGEIKFKRDSEQAAQE